MQDEHWKGQCSQFGHQLRSEKASDEMWLLHQAVPAPLTEVHEKRELFFFEKNIATSGENHGVLRRISCGDKLMSKNVEKRQKLKIYLVIWLLDFKFLEIHQGKWESSGMIPSVSLQLSCAFR